MSNKLFFIFLFLSITLATEAFAQTSPQFRRLPPSLERELKLRKGGKVRIIGFVDTLKAQSLIAQSIRDSSAQELDSLSVRDTAIVMIDSSVSLTDKEWLDSMLAELPEYRMTPGGIRFQYPPEILVETTRKVVPQDTTLPSRMDPVTKEDLPLYDALPMPRPLRTKSLPNTSIELGAGSPYLPQIDLHSLVVSNSKSVVELNGKYKLTSAFEPAVKQFWQIGASGNFLFPDVTESRGEEVPQLDIDLGTGANKRQLDSGEHTLSLTNINAKFTIGSPTAWKLGAMGYLSFLTESFEGARTENENGFNLTLDKNLDPISINVRVRFENVGQIALSLFETRALIAYHDNTTFQWGLGSQILSDGHSFNISPIVKLWKHFSKAFEIGTSFEPENKFIGLRELTATNLFYSPLLHSGYFSPKIVTEPIHLSVFASYFLSLDDELHAEVRLIDRNNEPVFHSDTIMNGHAVFYVTPQSTRRIEANVGGSILFFTKDKLRASVLIRAASDRGNSQDLPYEPSAQIQAAYQFGNISDKFIPQIEIMHLERVAHSFTFLNLEVRYDISPKFELKFRGENVLGNAGDFWTGYDEYPRSVWVSGRYAF